MLFLFLNWWKYINIIYRYWFSLFNVATPTPPPQKNHNTTYQTTILYILIKTNITCDLMKTIYKKINICELICIWFSHLWCFYNKHLYLHNPIKKKIKWKKNGEDKLTILGLVRTIGCFQTMPFSWDQLAAWQITWYDLSLVCCIWLVNLVLIYKPFLFFKMMQNCAT